MSPSSRRPRSSERAVPGLGGSARVGEVLARARGGERLTWDDGLALFREATLLEAGAAADAVRRRLHPRTASRTRSTGTSTTRTSASTAARSAPSTGLRATRRATSCPSRRSGGRSRRRSRSAARASSCRAASTRSCRSPSTRTSSRSCARVSARPPPRVLGAQIHFLAKKERTGVADVLAAPAEGGAAVPSRRRRRDPRGRRAQAHLGAHEGADGEVGGGAPRRAPPRDADDGHDDVRRRRDARAAPPPSRRRPPAQDESLAEGGESFTAFIPWTFQEENTALDGKVETAGGVDYLRTLAIARLYLDNVPHVQGSWLTQGAKIGSVAAAFGADDLGSIMIEENVVAAAGSHNRMEGEEAMRRLIRDSGFRPSSAARSTSAAARPAAATCPRSDRATPRSLAA